MAKLKIKSFKLADRFNAGIPDIYFAGGNWIETKVITRPPTIKGHPLRYFRPNQRIEMDALSQCGDGVFVAIYWDLEGGVRWFTFIPWWEFRCITHWTIPTIMELGVRIRTRSDLKMERFFNPDHALVYDENIWWRETFDKWIKENPTDFNPDWRPYWNDTKTFKENALEPAESEEDREEAEEDDD